MEPTKQGTTHVPGQTAAQATATQAAAAQAAVAQSNINAAAQHEQARSQVADHVDGLGLIKVVATARGFANGHLVEEGTAFMFDPTPQSGDQPHKLTKDGKQRLLPKWVVKAGDPKLKVPKPQAGDLKPKDAQAAVAAKAGALGQHVAR